MKILVACEESQAVTKEFRALEHEAYSCDILDCSGGHPEWHIQGDVLNELKKDKVSLDKDFYVFTGSTVGVVPILGKGLYIGKIEKLGTAKAIIN